MASQIDVAGKNIALDAIGAVGGYLAAYEDAAGTIEISGGNPAYARKAVTWNAASGGSKTNSGAVAFDIPAGKTVNAVGVVSALTGGTRYAIDEPASIESFTGQGVLNVASGAYSITLP
jgi:hypothetical protein